MAGWSRVPMTRRLLLLGGTTEARALAAALAHRADLDVVYSLADVTPDPLPVPVRVRRGGFGRVEGLVRYLREHRVDAVIDATHPFARHMSAHAEAACARCDVPRLVLGRAPWTPVAGDCWHEAGDLDAAAEIFGRIGKRGFLTLGARYWAPFLALDDAWWLVRAINAPANGEFAEHARSDHVTVILDRGPFSLEAERALLIEHRIDGIVTRNSGGEATRAKLDAARELALPVVMVQAPPRPSGPWVDSPDAALAWLDAGCPL